MRLPLSLLALTLAVAAPAPAAPGGGDFQYQGYAATYPTGLRLTVLRTAEVNRATVTVAYAVGAMDDPPGKEGLAQLAAELTAQTAGRDRLSLSQQLFTTGALTSTSVTDDEVSFRAVLRASQLDAVLAVEATRLRNTFLGVGEPQFQNLREAMASELEAREAPSYLDQEREAARARFLAGTRYARPRATAVSIRNITFQDVRRWVNAHLVPARAIVVVTGSEAPAAVGAKVLAAFGELAATGAPGEPRIAPQARAPAADTAAPAEQASDRVTIPGGRRSLWLSWRLPGDAAGRTASALAVEQVLTQRLSFAEVPGRGPILSGITLMLGVPVKASLWRHLDATAVVVRFPLPDGFDAKQVKEALVKAAVDPAPVLEKDASAVRFSPRRALIEQVGSGRFWPMEEGDFRDAAALVRATGAPDPLAVLKLQAEAQIQAEPLEAYYREFIKADAVSALIVESGPAVTPAPEAPAEERKWSANGPSPFEAAAPGPEHVRELVTPPGLSTTMRTRLGNGLEVVILPHGTLPIVEARLLVETDPPTGPLAGEIPNMAVQISKKTWSLWGDLGCVPSPYARHGEDLEFIERGPVGNLNAMLERLECWTKREVDDDRLDDSLDRLRKAGGLEQERGYRAVRALGRALFGEQSLPTDEALSTATAREAGRWLEAQLRPDRARLVIVGMVQPTPELQKALEKRFGGWKAGKPRAPAAEVPWPAARSVVLEDYPGARHAAIGIGVRLPTPARADDAAVRTLIQLVQWQLSRALLDETMHGVSLWVRPRGLPAAPTLEIWLHGPPLRTAQALPRVLATLEELHASPLDEVEVELARWFAARSEAYRFDTNQSTAAAIAEATFAGRPLESWDAMSERLAGVDAERVEAAAAASGFGHEGIAVLGDAKVVQPILEAAGLKPELLPAVASPKR